MTDHALVAAADGCGPFAGSFAFRFGHGFTETGAVSKEELRAYHKAMEAVIAEATRLYKAGVPVDDAIKQANWGEYASWTLASSQGPIAIRKVYEELSGTLK